METEEKKKSHWGKGIFALYGGFVVFIISIVLFAASQDYSLVDENYYTKGVQYQTRINQEKNSASLTEKPSWAVTPDKSMFLISFPALLRTDDFKGQIYFFRPSGKEYDQVIDLKLDESGQMVIPLESFIKGNWRIKLSWTSGGEDFYTEEMFTI